MGRYAGVADAFDGLVEFLERVANAPHMSELLFADTVYEVKLLQCGTGHERVEALDDGMYSVW